MKTTQVRHVENAFRAFNVAVKHGQGLCKLACFQLHLWSSQSDMADLVPQSFEGG